MSTSQRSEELARQFEAVNSEISELIASCSDVQWHQVCASEGWQLNVVAHHIAEVQQAFAGMVEKLANGETYTPTISMARIDESNAQHAREHADASKAETLELLQASQSAISRQLRDLNDDDLDRVAGTFGGNELTVSQVVEFVVIGHPAEHLASMRATVGD